MTTMASVVSSQTPALALKQKQRKQRGSRPRGQRILIQDPTSQELCRKFLMGRCNSGEKCRFVHQEKHGKERAPGRNGEGKGKQRQAPSMQEVIRADNDGGEGSNEQSTRPRCDHEQAVHTPTTPSTGPDPACKNTNGQRTSSRRPTRQKVYIAWQQAAREAKVAARTAQDNEEERLRAVESTRRLAEQEAIRQREAEAREVAARIAREAERLEGERQARLAHQEAVRKRELQEQEEEARRIQQAEQEALRQEREAAVTTQHIVLGSTLITCGAGIDIRRILSGFESCRLTIRNLPRSAKRREIVDLFTQQGMSPDDIHILHIKPVDDKTHLEAHVLTSSVQGGAIAIGLDGIEFGNENLQFQISEKISMDAMGESSSRQADTLTLSWQAPSAAMIATYPSMDEARAKVQGLNQHIIDGRRIKAVMNEPPTGPALRFYNPSSVKITGLSPTVSCDTVAALAGTASVRPIKSNSYDLQDVFTVLRQHLDLLPDSGMNSFDIVSQGGLDGSITVRARFDDWDHANRARESLMSRRLRPDYPIFRLSLPRPLQFISTIPCQQYQAQKRLWDSLAQTKDLKGSNIYLNTNERSVVRIRVNGDDKKAVGALKVRVETLVSGEKLEANFWHRSFLSAKGRAFLEKVFQESGAYVRSDFKVYALKIYGDGDAKEDARRMIAAEVERLAQLEWTVVLKRQTIGYFVRRGLAVLKDILGEDAVTLELASMPCKLTIRGGEEARHALNTIMDQSLNDLDQHHGDNGDDICPICYDEVSHPITLGCKHVYCTACLRHYLTSAADTKAFPLACLGDEAKCKAPIPIPVIQRFLTPQQYEHLIKVAFSAYLEQHSQDFRYCTTPDCSQIYRCNAETMLKCPSCFAEVCSACHEEAHKGMSCDERQQRKNEEERLNGTWAAMNGVKRCPSCQIWIEKTEGCNHMTCRCGAHICWRCMVVLPAARGIYDHLQEAHGGIYDGDDVRRNEDLQFAIALQGLNDEPRPFQHLAHEREVLALPAAPLAPPVARVRYAVVQPENRQRLEDDIQADYRQDLLRMREAEAAELARRQAEAQRARRRVEEARARERAEYQRQFDLRQARLLREAEERRRQEGRWCIVM